MDQIAELEISHFAYCGIFTLFNAFFALLLSRFQNRLSLKWLPGAFTLKGRSGISAASCSQLGSRAAWFCGGTKDRGLRRRRSLSPAESGPLASVSPRAKPAKLRSLCVGPPALPHPAPLNSARTRTPRIHATRTQNGDGREPEQPVRRGLPPRPLVTAENFIFQKCLENHAPLPASLRGSRNLCELAAEFSQPHHLFSSLQ